MNCLIEGFRPSRGATTFWSRLFSGKFDHGRCLVLQRGRRCGLVRDPDLLLINFHLGTQCFQQQLRILQAFHFQLILGAHDTFDIYRCL